MYDQHASGAGGAREDRLPVPGPEGAEIEHLHIDPLAGEARRRIERGVHRRRPGDEGEIPARPGAAGGAQGDRFDLLRHLALEPPEILVLHVDDRIVAADRRLEEAGVVRRRGRHHHHQPRDVHVPGLQRLAVLGGGRLPEPHRLPHHQRNPGLTAEHVAGLGGLVDELVDGAEGEVGEPHLHYRPGTGHRRSDRGPEDGVLGDRRVDHPFGAELLDQAAILAEHAAPAEILAHRPDVRVAPHLLGQGAAGGLEIGHPRHQKGRSSGEPRSCTSAKARARGGQAALRARS